MKFRNSVSWILIASQMGLGVMAASADTSAPAAVSPEFTLVENAIALQGQKLSQADEQNQLNALLTAYRVNVQAKAQAEGSQERFQQALVDLGVYTTAQAQSFVADAEAASARIAAAQPVSNAQIQNMAAQEITQLAATHPAGAQFSISSNDVACAASEGGMILGVAGAVGAIVGLAIRFDNPTCSAPTSYATVCGADGCSTATITGPTTCTNPGYYPHAQLGNDVMIGGGIAVAVGALVWYLGSSNCN